MNQYTESTPTKARVERRCTNTAWHPGCGAWIKPGEQYHKVKAPGLSDFVVCTKCHTHHKG